MTDTHFIFLHGGPGYRDYLAPYFRETLPEGYESHFYDQARGADVSVDALVRQLDGVVQSIWQKINEPIYLVGHSWGGALALEYLRQERSQIQGLVLIDACIRKNDVYDEFQAEMKRLNIREDDIESIFFAEDEKTEGRKLLIKINPEFDGEVFEKIERSYLRYLDLTEVVRALSIPILNIYGGNDVRIPARTIAGFRSLNDKIRTIEIAGAGHFPFVLPHRRDLIIEEIVRFSASKIQTNQP